MLSIEVYVSEYSVQACVQSKCITFLWYYVNLLYTIMKKINVYLV